MRRCFAAVSLSMQTYDRVVRYRRGPAASTSEPPLQQAQALESQPGPDSGLHEERDSAAGSSGRRAEDELHGSGHKRESGRRLRRRFSDTPVREDAADAHGSRQPMGSSERVRHTGRDPGSRRRERSRSPDRSRPRGRRGREGSPVMRRAGTCRARPSSRDEEAAGAGTDVLADLRARALLELQARRQACS